jgi:hypothetical protein
MCMWLTLPAHVDAHAVLVAARKRGVSFKPGDLFSSKEGSRAFRNHCRIVVAHYPEETLTRGLSILCDVVKDCTGAPALGMTAPFTTQETAPFTAQGERNHRSELSAPEELEFEACSMGL